MAEALRTEPSADSIDAIYTTYLDIRSEIESALIQLRNQRVTLQLTFENEPTLRSAGILDVLDGELLLEI